MYTGPIFELLQALLLAEACNATLDVKMEKLSNSLCCIFVSLLMKLLP